MKTPITPRQISQRMAFSLLIAATAIVVIPVIVIIVQIVVNGAGAISWEFLTQSPSQAGKAGGIFPAILGTFYLMLGTIIVALPLGVMAGIYLSELANPNSQDGHREPGRSTEYRLRSFRPGSIRIIIPIRYVPAGCQPYFSLPGTRYDGYYFP